jgi:dynein heavy chain
MDLVFFDDAIKHVIALLRILMQPRGNAMLIGVSGSGKQTLTKLAASTLEHECLQIKLSKNFTRKCCLPAVRVKTQPSS